MKGKRKKDWMKVAVAENNPAIFKRVVQEAIDSEEIQNAILSGDVLPRDAERIILAAGLEVPEDIKSVFSIEDKAIAQKLKSMQEFVNMLAEDFKEESVPVIPDVRIKSPDSYVTKVFESWFLNKDGEVAKFKVEELIEKLPEPRKEIYQKAWEEFKTEHNVYLKGDYYKIDNLSSLEVPAEDKFAEGGAVNLYVQLFQERIAAAQELSKRLPDSYSGRLQVNSNGSITLYHVTSESNSENIKLEGFRGGTFFFATKTSKYNGDSLLKYRDKHKDAVVMEVQVDPRYVSFSSGTGEFYAEQALVRDESGMYTQQDVLGKGGGIQLLAPNGKPSNLTPEQWHLVRTPEFLEWFGMWLPNTKSPNKPVEPRPDPRTLSDDSKTSIVVSGKHPLRSNDSLGNKDSHFDGNYSKVLDSNGEPLICYHGSSHKFNTFNYDKIGSQGTSEGFGFYFTSVKDIASGYATKRSVDGTLFEVFLNIRNPFSDTKRTITRDEIRKILLFLHEQDENALSNYGDVDYEGVNKVVFYAVEIENVSETDTQFIGSLINGGIAPIEDVLNAVRIVTGKDGVFTIWESDDRTVPLYICIEPNQIKLADGSNTTFNPKDSDVRFEQGGDISNSKKITKKEIQDAIQGTSDKEQKTAIQAAADYLRKSKGAGKESGGADFDKEAEWQILRKYIDEHNLWIDLEHSGDYVAEGAEQQVYLIDGRVVKSNNIGYYHSWNDYFNNLLLHNLFFPQTAYELIGFEKSTYGSFNAVVSQPFIEEDESTSLALVKKTMLENGFINNRNEDYINEELGIIIEDLHEGNVLTQNGLLYFIDTVFYLMPDKFQLGGAVDPEIECNHCGWTWTQEDGGTDMYVCHKCGYDNTADYIAEFASGGAVDSHKDIHHKWEELVNMSASELQKFYDSPEGKEAGLSKAEAHEKGIHYGRESARWIIRMKNTPVYDWTPEMWEWAKRQVSFISRMNGNEGALRDDKGRMTRKLTSLLIWGHNPEKMANGGEITGREIAFKDLPMDMQGLVIKLLNEYLFSSEGQPKIKFEDVTDFSFPIYSYDPNDILPNKSLLEGSYTKSNDAAYSMKSFSDSQRYPVLMMDGMLWDGTHRCYAAIKNGKHEIDVISVNDVLKYKRFSKGGEIAVPEFAVQDLTRYFEYVPTAEIIPYREHDREKVHKWDRNYLNKLTAKIAKNGISEPVTLDVDTRGYALVTEGNHRLAAALRLGIKFIPLRINQTNRTFVGTMYEHKGVKLPNPNYDKARHFGVQSEDLERSPMVYDFTKILASE